MGGSRKRSCEKGGSPSGGVAKSRFPKDREPVGESAVCEPAACESGVETQHHRRSEVQHAAPHRRRLTQPIYGYVGTRIVGWCRLWTARSPMEMGIFMGDVSGPFFFRPIFYYPFRR